MMNRRHFVAASTAALMTSPALAAPAYDLVIRGGRIIDPSQNLDVIGDVAIADGRIVSAGKHIEAGNAQTLDAKGKLVIPGIIDIHTHATAEPEDPGMMLKDDGVVAWIDAGSKGADNIDVAIAAAKASVTKGRVLINIGRKGILGGKGEGDTMDLSRADVAACKAAIASHKDWVVGIKARLSRDITANDYEVLKRAEEAAGDLPVMIHMGDTVTEFGKLVDLMKKGDIVSHMFAPPPHGIMDDNGKILPQVRAARKRGVIFDIGNGRLGHVRWDVVKSALDQDFAPDTYSDDWTMAGFKTGLLGMPQMMSNMMSFGVSLKEVITAATVRSASLFPAFKGMGTLAKGARADVAILDLQEGNFDFIDTFGGKHPGKQKLVTSAVVFGGRVV